MPRWVVGWVAGWMGCSGPPTADEAAGAGATNVCTEGMHHVLGCRGEAPFGAVEDEACTGDDACAWGCNLAATCEVLAGSDTSSGDFEAYVGCLEACVSADPGGGGTSATGYGTPGGTSATTGGGGYGTGTAGTSGGPEGEELRPECVAYAEAYCACVPGWAECEEWAYGTCDVFYDADPTYYDCVASTGSCDPEAC